MLGYRRRYRSKQTKQQNNNLFLPWTLNPKMQFLASFHRLRKQLRSPTHKRHLQIPLPACSTQPLWLRDTPVPGEDWGQSHTLEYSCLFGYHPFDFRGAHNMPVTTCCPSNQLKCARGQLCGLCAVPCTAARDVVLCWLEQTSFLI